MKSRSLLIGAAALVLALGAYMPANAATFIVDALANSSSGGTGVATISLTSGENFTVTVPVTDLWNAGALPRWSNADGLTGNLFATGSDDSGEPFGTLIGINFGTWTQNGLTAPYGTLVGEIGGIYQAIGTNFSGAAWNTGTLNLYYWDSNNYDNTQFITASVNAVPEPALWAMMIIGFLGVGATMRRTGNARLLPAG